MAPGLIDRVSALLERAAGHPEPEAAGAIGSAIRRMDEPIRVAIAGKVKAGKSTLLNALVGEELAPTDAGECTRYVTWYRDGLTYRVTAHMADGSSAPVPFHRDGGALEPDLGGRRVDDMSHLEVEWPSRRLRTVTLIDTPGIESISADISARTHRFLGADDDSPTEADAVVYLMRHMHNSDLRFLESFHDNELAHATPLNAIGVLSRADEVGACRLDAMRSADRIAGRYQADPQLRRLCQTVVPVAGLLAEAGCTLTEEEFGRLTTLAGHPAEDVKRLLLSVDRFVAEDPALSLVPAEREELLARLGLYGVRVAVSLIQVGAASTSADLCTELLRRSGIEALRSVLVDQFGERSDLLRARTAMATLDTVLRSHPHPDDDRIEADLERLTAETHEFTELRLLNAISQGAIPLPDAEAEELRRLVGGSGFGDRDRLGLSADVPDADLGRMALDAMSRWRRRAEHPMTARSAADAARVAVRSCEGVVTRTART
ncbi:MAG: dynamin family protein [Acidimicrobiia bacterium]|nr:dynamin family protein [Acidimicrobiia bacterium]